jgi:hypothetical protein
MSASSAAHVLRHVLFLHPQQSDFTLSINKEDNRRAVAMQQPIDFIGDGYE